MLSLVRCCAVQRKLLHSKTTPSIVLHPTKQAVRCFQKSLVLEKDGEDSRRSIGSLNEEEMKHPLGEPRAVPGVKDLSDKMDAGTGVPLKVIS